VSIASYISGLEFVKLLHGQRCFLIIHIEIIVNLLNFRTAVSGIDFIVNTDVSLGRLRTYLIELMKEQDVP